MESPARKWYQSMMTVGGSSPDTVTQACETAMVPKPSELDTPSVNGSTLQWLVRNHLVQPQNLQALEATLLRSGITSPCYPFPILFILCVGDVLRFCLHMGTYTILTLVTFYIDPCLTIWLRSPLIECCLNVCFLNHVIQILHYDLPDISCSFCYLLVNKMNFYHVMRWIFWLV